MIPLSLASKLSGAVVAGVIALSLVVGTIAWLRADAARDAVNQVAVDAAVTEQETRHEADTAARAAERSGAAERLRTGRF